MPVEIIGLYHELQWIDTRAVDRDRYQEKIRAAVMSSCCAVLEEAGNDEARSYAKSLAGKHIYRNIDIPDLAKQAIHYQRMAVTGEDHFQIRDRQNNIYVRSWNLVREWHMIASIEEILKENQSQFGNGTVLVICGLEHVAAVRRHLPEDVAVSQSLFCPKEL